MKNSFVIVIFSLLLGSCQLIGNIDTVKPAYSLPVEAGGKDAASAQLVMNGIYSSLRTSGFNVMPAIANYMGITAVPLSSSYDELQFLANDVEIFNPTLSSAYQGGYNVVQQTNLFIANLEKSTTMEAEDKDSYLAEARFIRAIAHWQLLQLFGQFYDLNSTYGMVVRLAPSTTEQAVKRSTVKETYQAILTDLDYAIAHAPPLTQNYRANVWAAKGFKARLLLYLGQYTQAAQLAQEVIQQSGRSFAPTYLSNFTQATQSAEILFAPYNSITEDTRGLYGTPFVINGTIYEQTADKADPRFGQQKGSLQYHNYRSTVVMLRLAELYFIQAEAQQRAAGSLVSAAAIEALNVVRTRQGIALPALKATAFTSAEAVLERIRIEKMAELYNENGETWYDIVRYTHAGNLGVGKVKPSLKKLHQYILPIPFAELYASKKMVIQNPGYSSDI